MSYSYGVINDTLGTFIKNVLRVIVFILLCLFIAIVAYRQGKHDGMKAYEKSLPTTEAPWPPAPKKDD